MSELKMSQKDFDSAFAQIDEQQTEECRDMIEKLADHLENELGDTDLANYGDTSRRVLFLSISAGMAKIVSDWMISDI